MFKGCSGLFGPEPWCSTKLDENGVHQKGHWGACNKKCNLDPRGHLLSENGTCLANEFKCKDGRTCVSLSSTCDDKIDCEDGSDEENCKGPQEIECGRPFVKEGCDPRYIFGGSETCIEQFPWLASIRVLSETSHTCGAALVNKNWIATAAHCVQSSGHDRTPDEFYIRMGANDLTDGKYIQRKVSLVVSHPEYNNKTFSNDLALLKLDENVVLSDTVKPICLPKDDNLFTGENKPKGIAAGWGRFRHDHPFSSKKMKFVSIPINEKERCEEMFVNGGLLVKMKENQICAGFEVGGSDTCQGDSGGPLMHSSFDGVFELTGITSWGIGCGNPNSPGVYTKVSSYLKWIHNLIYEDRQPAEREF